MSRFSEGARRFWQVFLTVVFGLFAVAQIVGTVVDPTLRNVAATCALCVLVGLAWWVWEAAPTRPGEPKPREVLVFAGRIVVFFGWMTLAAWMLPS